MGVTLDAGGGDKTVKPNINVTPLVDVVLVLLIIFMLVIPNMQEGVPIELFKATNADKDEAESDPITVSIARGEGDEGGGPDDIDYYLGGAEGDRQLSREALIAELMRLHETDPSRALLVRGDARIEYGNIREVFHECQNLGFAYIRLAVGAKKESWQEG